MANEKPVVAFLGPKASYTHQATLDYFPESQYTYSPQISIEDVFSAVQSGTASRGVIPFENSTNGSVVFTLDLFADRDDRYPDIQVCGETYVKVSHCLLGHSKLETQHQQELKAIEESPQTSGHVTPTTSAFETLKNQTKPSTSLSHIRKIYSHPQAWGQCNVFLQKYLKGIERQDVSSTSKAAELVAADTTGTTAAISSQIAAQMNNLEILAQGIEDSKDNTTRFFVIRRGSSSASPTPPPPSQGANAGNEDLSYKSLISFTVPHTSPGALADSLAVFGHHNLNLTSINARPSGLQPWHYIFFVEIMGRKEDGDGEEGAVNRALGELGGVARGWRWLGSWVDRAGSVLSGL